jgi:hypothetical protein
VLRPTRAIDAKPHIGWDFERSYFAPVPFSPDTVSLGNRHRIAGGFDVDWRFFPRTRFVLETTIGQVVWAGSNVLTTVAGGQVPTTFWKIFVGVKGDLTRKLSMQAQFGYGNAYFPAASGIPNLTAAEGILGRFELAIRPSPLHRIAFGFARDFDHLYYTPRVDSTQVYVKYQGLLFDRLTAQGEFSWLLRNLVGGSVDRLEHQWTAGLNLSFMVVRFFHIEGGYRFSAVGPTDNGTGRYVDHRGQIGVTFGFK